MMRLLWGLVLAFFLLAGCERSPREKLAFEHAEKQVEINEANFERNKERREAMQDMLQRQFDASQEMERGDDGSP